MISKRANPGLAPGAVRPGDCYDTPPQAVAALQKVERLPARIWEPCCGVGNIVGALRGAGHHVVASDISDRGCPGSFLQDFLTAPVGLVDCEAIVTNPPYRHAAEFVARGLEHAPLVLMLLRLAFLESRRRSSILDRAGLARIHVFANRLPTMHRAGWTGRHAGNAIAFAWFAWERGHIGPTLVDRIIWE